jgi:hypothetical protein
MAMAAILCGQQERIELSFEIGVWRGSFVPWDRSCRLGERKGREGTGEVGLNSPHCFVLSTMLDLARGCPFMLQ